MLKGIFFSLGLPALLGSPFAKRSERANPPTQPNKRKVAGTPFRMRYTPPGKESFLSVGRPRLGALALLLRVLEWVSYGKAFFRLFRTPSRGASVEPGWASPGSIATRPHQTPCREPLVSLPCGIVVMFS